MPLRLTLKPYERLIINGCVLRNGARRQVLEIENRADLLRGDEMLDAESANTPVRRLAFDIQIALVSREHRAAYNLKIARAIDALIHALPRQEALLREVETLVQNAEYYTALRTLPPLFAYEAQLLKGLSL